MRVLIDVGILLTAYIFGSIPFGLLIVKGLTGKDIRTVESGRTGGTNAFRAAGLKAGLFTAILDILKSAATVWLARELSPDTWIHVLAPVAAVLGHNHSVFLPERRPNGRWHLRGGAGGAAALGGTLGLWYPAVFIMLPIGFLLWWGIGYASITTLSVGLMTMAIFAVRAALGYEWQYVVYGLLVELLMLWALRPNLKRLLSGTERRHGLPVRLQEMRKKREQVPDPKATDKESDLPK